MKAILIFAVLSTGCTTIRPYEKEYLVSPIMEDKTSGKLEGRFTREASTASERLANAGRGGAGAGGSCPTCGG